MSILVVAMGSKPWVTPSDHLVLLLEHLIGWGGSGVDAGKVGLGIAVHDARRSSCWGLLSLHIITPKEGSTPLKPPPMLKEFAFDWWKVLLGARHLGGK